MEEILKKTEEAIRSKTLLSAGETVLSAFSGGADSLCLLVILQELSKEMGFRVAAGHVHHMIRKESADRDAAFCKSFCEERGIPFYFRKEDVPAYAEENGLSLEEAARVLRYQALQEMRVEAAAEKIAAAHHREDQAETLLFQLIRGSGLRGLSGMRPVNGRIIRPLLGVSKEEILEFLKKRGLSWCEDETNWEDSGSRAKIRHRVIPALADVREDAVLNLVRTAEYLGRLDAFFREEAEKWYLARADKEKAGRVTAVFLPGDDLPDALPLREYVVRLGLEKCGAGLKDVTREHIEGILELFEKQVGKRRMLPGGTEALRTYSGVRLTVAGGKAEGDSDFQGVKRGETALPSLETSVFPNKKGLTFPEKEYTKCFDYDKINGPLKVRYREEGDLFSTRAGTTKKLKDYMIDEKIPREERDRIPLVADGKSVLWVVGYRMSENYKVSEATKEIMEIRVTESLNGGENAG